MLLNHIVKPITINKIYIPVLAAILAVSILNCEAKSRVRTVDIIGELSSGEAISGTAKIFSSKNGKSISKINVTMDRVSQTLEDNIERGDTLEAWLVDNGRGNSASTSSVSNDDPKKAFSTETTSTGFLVQDVSGNNVLLGNIALDRLLEAAPYPLSLGTFKRNDEGNYVLTYRVRNGLRPYDFLMITKETKGNRGDYDPRPGTEITRTNVSL